MDVAYIKFRECDLEVKGVGQRAEKAVYYDRNGDPGTPGCSASFEVCEVWYNGIDVFALLCDEDIEKIEELILKG